MATVKRAVAHTTRPAPDNARPAWIRLGHMLLFGVYVALLAGRFSLERLSESLPAFDLRIVMLYALASGTMVWMMGAHRHFPQRTRARQSTIFAVWLGWMALSASWAPSNARTSVLTDLILLASFLSIALLLMVYLPRDVTERVWKWVFWTGLIYFVGAMLEGPGAQGRYSAFGGGPNVFVRVMVLGAIAALYLSSTRNKLRYLAGIPAFAMGAALSGSRGGLASAAVLFLLFLFPVARMIGAKRVIGLAFIGTIGAGLAAAWNDGAVVSFIHSRIIQQTFVERYASGRTDIAEQALALWRENGVFGVGLDGYYALQPEQGGFEYPHNLLLASAAEGGTIGAILVILAVLRLFSSIGSQRPIGPGSLTAALAGLFLFGAGLFSGDYYDSRLMWFFLLLASVEANRPRAEASVTVDQIAPQQRVNWRRARGSAA